MISRRTFLAGGGAALLAQRSREQRIAVRLDSEFGRVRPELHGHFAEHLGTCVYGGLWDGKGYNQTAIRYLREVGIPVLRWPGGCFADDYHWRDGIGPVAKRPRRVNIWWGNYTEDNSFGTHEFMGLCRAIGAQPYFAGNVGSGTPAELRDWMEYCNYPSGSTLSDERAANGARQPFNVRYWGVGNENWGCGGSMTPEEYCGLYRRFATFARFRGDSNLFLVACGPSSHDLNWTRRFFDTLGRRPRLDGYAMHFYSNGKSPARKFTVETMQEQLSSFARMETAIVEQRALMDKYDPKGAIGLMVDEWGVWDRIQPEDEKRYGKLFQDIPMRSAVAAALGLNVFHRQADKLVMCNIAQLVNVLHSLLLIDRGKVVRTTTYHAFEMMKEHRGATAVRVDSGAGNPLDLSVSASRQGKALALTAVNPSHDTGIAVECALEGGSAAGATARILHHADFNATNDFANPDLIVPRSHPVDTAGGRLKFEAPPLSIVHLSAKLA